MTAELRKKLARKKQDMAAKMRAVTLAADKLILETDDIAVREQQLQVYVDGTSIESCAVA